MPNTVEGYINGKPLNPNRDLPHRTLAQAQAEGLTSSNRLWVRTDAPQSDLIVDNLTTDDSARALSAKQGKVLNDKIKGTMTEIVNVLATQTGLDIDISGYDELYTELRFYGNPFMTMTYKNISASATYRINGFVDSTANFASASIDTNANKHITAVNVTNVVGSGATRLVVYGVKHYSV